MNNAVNNKLDMYIRKKNYFIFVLYEIFQDISLKVKPEKSQINIDLTLTMLTSVTFLLTLCLNLERDNELCMSHISFVISNY